MLDATLPFPTPSTQGVGFFYSYPLADFCKNRNFEPLVNLEKLEPLEKLELLGI